MSWIEGRVMSKTGDYMSTPVLTTSPDTLAYDAVEKMCGNQVSALLVEQSVAHHEKGQCFALTRE